MKQEVPRSVRVVLMKASPQWEQTVNDIASGKYHGDELAIKKVLNRFLPAKDPIFGFAYCHRFLLRHACILAIIENNFYILDFGILFGKVKIENFNESGKHGNRKPKITKVNCSQLEARCTNTVLRIQGRTKSTAKFPNELGDDRYTPTNGGKANQIFSYIQGQQRVAEPSK